MQYDSFGAATVACASAGDPRTAPAVALGFGFLSALASRNVIKQV
jgi:hypothetical protein